MRGSPQAPPLLLVTRHCGNQVLSHEADIAKVCRSGRPRRGSTIRGKREGRTVRRSGEVLKGLWQIRAFSECMGKERLKSSWWQLISPI